MANIIFKITQTGPDDDPPYLNRISESVIDKIDATRTFRAGIRLSEKRIFFPRRRKDKRKL